MTTSHRWRRVTPVIVPLGEEERYPGQVTHNAVCDRCGRKEWLHWPSTDLHESNRPEKQEVHQINN